MQNGHNRQTGILTVENMAMTRRTIVFLAVVAAVISAAGWFPQEARAEAMLQYFNTSYAEITDKMPELAEAGYSSIWLPPPTKGSGGLSVGYDLWDPLDIGGKDQRGSIRTRYGTEAELMILLETAHRFGIRIYFDNIMNHRAFDIPGYNEGTDIYIYPGMVPEDFHLRVTEEGYYRKWDNCRDWNSTWQVQNLGLADLIDIAHETPNDNFGANEGDDHPKISFIRHPNNPEYYLDTDLPISVGYGIYSWSEYTFANKEPYDDVGYTNASAVFVSAAVGNGKFDWEDLNANGQHDVGETGESFDDTGLDPSRWTSADRGYGDGKYNMGNPGYEDVGAYLIRAGRWLMDYTRADGLRLDAVKHVPAYFFGDYGSDTSGNGYCGGAQVQFNVSRGFSDWDNHRDTVFNTEGNRDDAMMFGEHLGEPPGYGDYLGRGMRLVDNPLRNEFNSRLGSPWNGLSGYDQSGYGGFSAACGVMHAQSHDNDYASRRELQHAFYFTRDGLGLLYTDGNHHAETLGESGGAFPRHANTAFLGQWGDLRIPNLLYIHEQFGRGYQKGVWSDGDYVAYQRMDWRQGGSTDGDKVVMLIMINDDYSGGQARDIRGSISFGHTPFVDDAYLYNYSTYGGGFYTYASALNTVIVPAGGYFVFSWRTPEESALWSGFGGDPVTFYENGRQAGTMSYTRTDGPDGDANYNPYGVADTNAADYSYTYTIPRVTSSTNLRIVARADGSAANVLLRLDGGVDLDGDGRDNPPALSSDVYLGFEQPSFVKRIYKEKFAAADSARNRIGSAGAETYHMTIGSTGYRTNYSNGANDWDNSETAMWIWHNPQSTTDLGPNHFTPAPDSAAGTSITVWVKSGNQFNMNNVALYYTTNGTTWPEGAGGEGYEQTRVVPFAWDHNQYESTTNDWWKATIPALPAGTVLRYKIGCYKQQGEGTWSVTWPADAGAVATKLNRMGVWEVTNINAAALTVYPHNDYGNKYTGLREGFHLLTARAFLERDARAALYNTFKQTFYYDAARPGGYIQYPAADGDAVGGQQYGAVVRSDHSVREAWFHIDDADPSNDDTATGVANGNGNGFEPYTDGNNDGGYDLGEAFEDLNQNGSWDSNIGQSWVHAYQTTPGDMATDYPKEWRFTYNNIPAGGSNATIAVRLREWSSAERAVFTNYTDTTGHFTTLTRTVKTWGPDVRMFIAWPQQDGDTVGEGYVMKTYFTKSLADGLSEQDLINRFLIKIQSSESGRTTGGVAQSRSAYSIDWDEGDYYALLFTLPNLYNGDPNWLHGLEVTHERPSMADLVATRLVKAAQAEEAPYVAIIEPPEYGSDGSPHEIIIPDEAAPSPEELRTTVRVETATNVATLNISFGSWPADYFPGGGMSFVSNSIVGSTKYWDYDWSNLVAGTYRFTAWVFTPSGASNSASRNATVVQREWVSANTNDLDDDDDGLLDDNETTAEPLPSLREINPEPNPENWDNGEVHIHYAYGKSLPQSPDSDADGLSDGLEVGWRNPASATDTNADTNGDGWPNFRADYDPPFYNTLDNEGKVPGVNSRSQGGDRALQLYGSTTDPSNPDTDYDGLPDGIEDANRNGWVEGDGAVIDPTWDPWLARSWPNDRLDVGETWTETDPNDSDTDNDNLSDGNGEDKDFDGRIAGDANTNRVYNAGEEWSETDPLNADTDDDGLTDGWEVQYNFDPLDDGSNSLRTAVAADGNVTNGAAGDPDADTFDNATELANGTNPRYADTGVPPPEGTITIGRGPALGITGGVTNYQEFTDWTAADLIALDDYNNGGSQAVDIYRAWDGFDSSRDLVAFYAHDGGDLALGGDGMFYFRVDLQDLQALAEDAYVDIYVIVDMNSPTIGEYSLPDSADLVTEMKWEAAVAVYGGNNGRVYVDTERGNNSLSAVDDLAPFGVVARNQATASGFGQAYFNSDLDAVEFSISRQALRDAGWNGLNPNQLNYQVYTTKDGTQNSPLGPGDIGGRNDLRDSITDDWVCSDYWRDQNNIIANGRLYGHLGRSADNDFGKSAKIAMVMHGNQAIQPGSEIQDLVNNGVGAGYHRALDVHEVFSQPMNLHITPTLAAALEWARVDTNASATWRDGPTFNDRLRTLVATNVVWLLGSTFSDHILPYFTSAFNADNASLAGEFLHTIYGAQFTGSTPFWPAERVLDDDVFAKIQAMGFGFTIMDADTHMWEWFGRYAALGDDGYRVNRVHGVYCFVINNAACEYRFANTDSGLGTALRELLNRRARSSTQDQLVTILSNWEDFGSSSQADAYDRNLRWLANHPWTQLVSLEEVAAGEVDTDGDGNGNYFGNIDRGSPTLSKQGHNWVNHSTQGDYDSWYCGSGQEESLQNKQFDIRPGTQVPTAYGMLYFTGIISQAWERVNAIANSNVAQLARAVLHASLFETAFHDEDNNNLSRFSTGDYIYPDSSSNSLAAFAANAQSQTRLAAMYARVDTWAASAAGVTTPQASAEDVDLDGESEYLLYNNRVCAVFERIGGRLVAAWYRDVVDSQVYQVVGNAAGYSGAATEEEGTYNVETNRDVVAYRTSCLKDWWLAPAGTAQYVNDLYAAAGVAGGWRFTSSDGKIQKTITLATNTPKLEVAYVLSGVGATSLYVRNGLSPNLYNLLLRGQRTLAPARASGGVVSVAETNYATTVTAWLGYGDAGHAAGYIDSAVDDNPGSGVSFYTLNMRNQAQTHQVELVGTNTFTFALGFSAGASDWDSDGMPNTYSDRYDLEAHPQGGADQDADGDRISNKDEYVAGTSPLDGTDYLYVNDPTLQGSNIRLLFPTELNRRYFVWYKNNLLRDATWSLATPAGLSGTGAGYQWTDDGAHTAPPPGVATSRYYRIEVALPD